MRILTLPLSKVYRAAADLRTYLYAREIFKSYKSKLPVISIGNISAGGTGKTPLCIFLVEALKARGYNPAVLSRGYGGSYKGVHVVAESDSPSLCGDEPLLIYRETKQPTILARKRAEGAKFIEENKLGDIIVMDDAFQHFAIRRDVDIVVLNVSDQDSVNDLLHDRLLPFGKSREATGPALARADIILLSNRLPQSKAPQINKRILEKIPANKVIVTGYFEPSGVYACGTNEKLNSPSEVAAFCAIANPQVFFTTLESLGFSVRGRAAKPDHQVFSEVELERFKAEFPGLPLVCTEKDAVKLEVAGNKEIYVLKGRTKIVPEDAFVVQIEKKLKTGTRI